jgi:hypothetical protein
MWILVGLTDPMVDLEKWCIKDVQVMYKNHFSLNFSFLKNKNKNKQLDNVPQDENTWRWTTKNTLVSSPNTPPIDNTKQRL